MSLVICTSFSDPLCWKLLPATLVYLLAVQVFRSCWKDWWIAEHAENDPGVLPHQLLPSVCSYFSCPFPQSRGPEGYNAQLSIQWSLFSEAFTKMATGFAHISSRLDLLVPDSQPPTWDFLLIDWAGLLQLQSSEISPICSVSSCCDRTLWQRPILGTKSVFELTIPGWQWQQHQGHRT